MVHVLVIGSINMDLVTQTPEFPRLGQTLFGSQFATHPGGKGANQAVAAARLGARVTLVGRVGSDAFGRDLKEGLAREGVDTRWVTEAADSSGVASITVCNGDNAILVVQGANALLSPDDLDAAESAFAAADVVVSQLEVPLATVEYAARLAERNGRPFMLNPAPAMKLPQALLERCRLVTPNEYELGTALGQPQGRWQDLLPQLPGRVVMTKGAEGAYYTDGSGKVLHQDAFRVKPIDSTGAGDTFSGALATFWHLGFAEAVRRGCAAAALSVTKPGAQDGMPTLAELEAFLGSPG